MFQQLLPGFRFYPTEEELINFYLHIKLHGQSPEIDKLIPSIDIYNFEPSQLPEQAGQRCQGDSEQWFFFMPQQEREARGGRPNRTTATGYWKATGSLSCVYSSQNKVIGVKKTMVFYKGKAPTGRKTKWKMNEYKATIQDDTNVVSTNNDPSSSSTFPKTRQELSLCRVYVTSGCARAFDRRPIPGTTTLNTTTSTTQKVNTSTCDHNLQEVGQVSGWSSGASQDAINATTLKFVEKSIISTTDDSSNNSMGHDHGTPFADEGSRHSCDFEMTQSLDSLIDWEQLGWF